MPPGLKPLLTVVAILTTKSIEQSFPLVAASNTITVAFTASVDFVAGSFITLAGLAGTQTADTTSLAVTSSPADVFENGVGVWSLTGETLVLTVATPAPYTLNPKTHPPPPQIPHPNKSPTPTNPKPQPLHQVAAGGLSADTDYTVSFVVQNGAAAQGAVTASFLANLDPGGVDYSFLSVDLDSATGNLLSVTNGASPLLLVVPAFDVYDVGQSMPLVSASNTITVTLEGNVDFPATSTITLSGLAGTQTADDAALVVGGADGGLFGSAGDWSDSGTLILTVDSVALSAGTSYTVSFSVQNTATAQGAVTVSVSASLDSGGVDDSPLGIDMNPDTGFMLGVTNGASPLLTVVPTFTAKSIGQSSPLNGVKNTLTITLTSDVDLAATSTVTIAGLTGTQTVTETAQAITSAPSNYGTAANWDEDGVRSQLLKLEQLAWCCVCICW